MNKILKTLSASTLLLSLSTALAQAQEIGSTIGGAPLTVKRLGPVGVSSIGRLISASFNVAVLVAAIVVFFMLILGGYGWMTAGGDKAKVEEARTRITNALIGLAIVAAAWALITIVGQFFGVDIANLSFPSAVGSNTPGDTAGGGF